MKKITKSIFLLFLTATLVACDAFDGDDNNSSGMNEEKGSVTVVDVAVSNGNFTTLVAALQATGLDSVLDDEDGSFTVFAPTDAAFDLLGEETINALLADSDRLSDILLYHVVSGSEIDSAMAVAAAGSKITMANGDAAAVSLAEENVYVNLSMVTSVDIVADNGIIHVLDAVLMPPAEMATPTQNIAEIAAADGNFTTLVAALQAAGLDTALADTNQMYTVFAPTDAAFNLLGENIIGDLLADTDALTAVLSQHVVPGALVDSVSAYTLNGSNASTLGGADIPVSIMNNQLVVGGATVLSKAIYATNGVIHVIDAVIVADLELPRAEASIAEVAAAAGNFDTLVAALQATGLDATLASTSETFTVFAPTDDAFAALGQETINALLADTDTLSDILLYHVISESEVLAASAIDLAGSTVSMANGDQAALSLSGSSLLINKSTVASPNILTANGVIHVIDKVMLPPSEMGSPDQNIVETAIADGRFTTLVSAVQAAGLVETLADESASYTVFAPTDDAFALIDDAQLSALIGDIDALTEVLLQHVLEGSVDALTAYTLNGMSTTTVSGNAIDISIVDGMLTAGGAKVIIENIYTSNGIIHVIDAVIVGDVEFPAP